MLKQQRADLWGSEGCLDLILLTLTSRVAECSLAGMPWKNLLAPLKRLISDLPRLAT